MLRECLIAVLFLNARAPAEPPKIAPQTREPAEAAKPRAQECIQQLIQQLHASEYRKREQATRELEAIVRQLEAALERASSPEVHKRLERVLNAYRTPNTDLDRLQGTWKLSGLEKDGKKLAHQDLGSRLEKFTITGRTITRADPSPGARFGRLVTSSEIGVIVELHASVQPKVIEVAGFTHWWAIYDLRGDTLTIRFDVDKHRRPAEFQSFPDDATVLLFTYQRE